MKKTCYNCVETQGRDFGGVCSEAGEIGGSFCEQEHPECFRNGRLFDKRRIEQVGRLLYLQEDKIDDENDGTDEGERKAMVATAANQRVLKLYERLSNLFERYYPELYEAGGEEDDWYHKFSPIDAERDIDFNIGALEEQKSKGIEHLPLLMSTVDQLCELLEYYDIVGGDYCPYGELFREEQDKENMLSEGEDPRENEPHPIHENCVKCCNPDCINSPTD